MWDGGLVGMIDAIEIDLHDLVELGGGLLQEGGFLAQDAGTADQDVKAAKGGDGLFDKAAWTAASSVTSVGI